MALLPLVSGDSKPRYEGGGRDDGSFARSLSEDDSQYGERIEHVNSQMNIFSFKAFAFPFQCGNFYFTPV